MHVRELVTKLHEIIGRDVSVDGVLLVGRDSRLVASVDRPEDGCVLLPHVQVKKRLLEVVPPWCGGPNIYHEDATVVGVLSDGPPRFVTVRNIVVHRDDMTYQLADLA